MTSKNEKTNTLLGIIKSVFRDLPDYVKKLIFRTSPIFLLSGILDLFGLAMIFPVINFTLTPSKIHSNNYSERLYNYFNFQNEQEFIFYLFIILSFAFILKSILFYFLYKHQFKKAFELSERLSNEKHAYYLFSKEQINESTNSSEILRNITQLPFELVMYMIIPIINLINEVFIVTIIIIAIAFVNPTMLFILLILIIPIFFFYTRVFRKKLNNISLERDEAHKELFSIGNDNISTFSEIVLFKKSDYFKNKFANRVKKYSSINRQFNLFNAYSPKNIETIAVVSISLIFIVGSLINLPISSISTFLMIFAVSAFRLIPSLNKVMLSTNYIKSSAYIVKYFHSNVLVSSINNDIKKEISFSEKIELRNLTFGFNDKELLFENLNLTIQKGKTIGIIGKSGLGKSTLLNILIGRIQIPTNTFFIDNQIINENSLGSLYSLISYVPQKINLINGSVIENICFGVEASKIDYQKFKHVSQLACLDSLINELPLQENTNVGEDGSLLSGGQRQRIGIARALYHGGQIIILDEATSALDSATESELTNAMQNLSSENYTLIIVAHRKETLKYCNEIYELKNKNLLKTIQ